MQRNRISRQSRKPCAMIARRSYVVAKAEGFRLR